MVIPQSSSWADKAAQYISIIFHPLIIVIPTLLVAATGLGVPIWETILWTILSVSLVNLPIIILIYLGVRSGRYNNYSISIRQQRNSIFVTGGILLVVLLVILTLGHAPAIFRACLVSAVIATMIGTLINLRTKISMHAAAVAGCTAVLLWTVPIAGFIFLVCMPLVGWARIRLKHHTPFQILIGWLVPVASVVLIFRWML
ncbi:MAG: hypothetical protein PHQ40_08630 [Anaerolineaceae bacterium]|nr:hypothetical protein [Anaerolineaceae bacterium]